MPEAANLMRTSPSRGSSSSSSVSSHGLPGSRMTAARVLMTASVMIVDEIVYVFVTIMPGGGRVG
jgi:hypothetical protein